MRFIFIFVMLSSALYSQLLWENQQSGFVIISKKIAVLNSDVTFIVGRDQNIGFHLFLRTLDGGKNWERKTYVHENNLGHSVHTIDKNHLYVMNVAGEIYLSRDLGDSWEMISKMPTEMSSHLPTIIFFDTLRFIVLSYDENISEPKTRYFKTSDAGKTWKEFNLSPSIGSDARYFVIGDRYCWLSYGDRAVRTTDGGETWVDISHYLSAAMYYLTPLIGWQGGFRNINGRTTLGKTTDGGITWDTLSGTSKNSN